MLYVGPDVHQRSTAVCVLDELGREREHRNVKGHPRMAVEFLRGLQEPLAMCYEASCGDGWLYEHRGKLAASSVESNCG